MVHHHEGDEGMERDCEEPTCYLQQVVGEPTTRQSGAGKSAAKLREGPKPMQTVKRKITKDRELMHQRRRRPKEYRTNQTHPRGLHPRVRVQDGRQ